MGATVWPIHGHSVSEDSAFMSSANLAAIVGLPFVSLLIDTTCAVSFARRAAQAGVRGQEHGV